MNAVLLRSTCWKPRALYDRFVWSQCGRGLPAATGSIWNQGSRRGAHRKHRTVTVQLLADVPGLGLPGHSNPISLLPLYSLVPGSIHKVAPGYMRNLLKPKNLAEYAEKNNKNWSASTIIATPTPVDISSQAKTPSLNVGELAERVAALPALKFYRRLQTDDAIPPLPSKPILIYGSVTTQDIVKLIESEHGLTLVAPDTVVAFQNGQDRLRHTGSEVVEVNFSNGSTVYLGIEVVEAG